MTKQEKSEHAYATIDGYNENESLEECVIDILTDLQHLCDVEEMDFAALMQMAQTHYEAEK